MAINWFPGHMHKARKEIAQTMPRVDLLIELVDARIPYSSANPLVPELRGDKPLLKVLNKVDLADPEMTRIWIEHFEKEDGVKAIPLEARLPHQLKTLLAMGRNSGEQIKLEELALPFAEEVSRHLRIADRQCISASSSYLEACRSFNREEISREKLQSLTCKLGFQNVIDAFHVVARDEIPIRFFTDERSTDGAIRLTDNFFALRR